MKRTAHLRIELHSDSFDPYNLLEQWQQELIDQQRELSAADSLFIGRVRARSAEGATLTALELEHYPGMTERHLRELAISCCERHDALSCLIAHRIGKVCPGEAIVLVTIGADRRGQAQRCCQELLEDLKHEAPFWKREWRTDGSSEWLTGNTPF
jgi:molybdopterin synthase catalytic subunit